MQQDYVSLMVWAFVKPLLIAGALLGALIAAFAYPKAFLFIFVGFMLLVLSGFVVMVADAISANHNR